MTEVNGNTGQTKGPIQSKPFWGTYDFTVVPHSEKAELLYPMEFILAV